MGHPRLCKLWIFEFYAILILKVSDSEYIEAIVDFLLNHVRCQTRKLYELVGTDFYETVVLKFIIKKKIKCSFKYTLIQCGTRCADTFTTSSICRNCKQPETRVLVIDTTMFGI